MGKEITHKTPLADNGGVFPLLYHAFYRLSTERDRIFCFAKKAYTSSSCFFEKRVGRQEKKEKYKNSLTIRRAYGKMGYTMG
jgi:hypothetical protein